LTAVRRDIVFPPFAEENAIINGTQVTAQRNQFIGIQHPELVQRRHLVRCHYPREMTTCRMDIGRVMLYDGTLDDGTLEEGVGLVCGRQKMADDIGGTG
jgi:hypothetical protein